jgi:hypothetical protein
MDIVPLTPRLAAAALYRHMRVTRRELRPASRFAASCSRVDLARLSGAQTLRGASQA